MGDGFLWSLCGFVVGWWYGGLLLREELEETVCGAVLSVLG